jgi:hypothetical protein
MPKRVAARPTASSIDDRASDLTSLRDIGDVSARWLRAVGITTVSELRRVGPVEAYGRVVFRFGKAANRNLLYALAMGLEGRAYNAATEAEKRKLCAEAGIAYPARASAPRHPGRRR